MHYAKSNRTKSGFKSTYLPLFIHLLKKSEALCLCGGKLSKLSVRTGPSDLRLLPLFLSDVESASRFNGVFALGVVGVLIPMDGVLDEDTLRGEGV